MLRAALRSLLQHKLRLGLTLVAVVVGVAFVAGTYIFTDSLKRSFDALFTSPLPDLTITPDTQLESNPGGGGAGGGLFPISSHLQRRFDCLCAFLSSRHHRLVRWLLGSRL